MIEISDEARRDLGLPSDCGIFDPVRNTWLVRESDLERYRPDVLRMITGGAADAAEKVE